MDYEFIMYQKNEGISIITLNRPGVLNAVNSRMIDELVSALDDARNDQSVKVVVLTGAGRSFCSGVEVKALVTGDRYFSARDVTQVQARTQGRSGVQKVPRLIKSIEKPIIASINGVAYGFGFDLASMCDIRIASDKASFSINHLRIGALSLDGGYYYLVRILGVSRTLRLVWTSEVFDAVKAKDMGYISQVVTGDDLAKVTLELAGILARGPVLHIRVAKRLIYNACDSSLDEALEDVDTAWALTQFTRDAEEGLKAVLEKRAPHFEGR